MSNGIDYEYFNEVILKLKESGNLEKMNEYISHSDVTVLNHVMQVAKECYTYAVLNNVKCNLEDLITCAVLHDYYLYDWHEKSTWHKWHGFKHHKFAANNAVRDFNVNKKVEKAILSHMFPLTIWQIPSSVEGWILTMVDKKVAFKETMRKYSKKYKID